jgi:hypothetical protein
MNFFELTAFVALIWLILVVGLSAAGRPAPLFGLWCMTYAVCGSVITILGVLNWARSRLRRGKGTKGQTNDLD